MSEIEYDVTVYVEHSRNLKELVELFQNINQGHADKASKMLKTMGLKKKLSIQELIDIKDRILNRVDVKSNLVGKILTWGRINAGNSFVPSPPTNLSVTPVSISQIDLSWGAANDAFGVTGYLVERCQGAGCTTFAQIATLPGTSFSDTGLASSTHCRLRRSLSTTQV